MTEIPRFRQSMCKPLLTESPAALKWQLDHGREPTRQMEKGTLVHAMVLGTVAFHVIQATLASGKRKGERATNFQCTAAQVEADEARASGLIPVFQAELEELQRLAENVRRALREHGADPCECECEKPHQWLGDAGLFGAGVECEGTPDMRSVGATIDTYDIKVGFTANPDRWDSKLYDDCADIQAAAYEEQALSQHGTGRPTRHFIVAAELDKHCPVTILPLSECYLELGRKRWLRGKRLWQRCWETGEWPGYVSRPLSPPNYIIQREEFIQ